MVGIIWFLFWQLAGITISQYAFPKFRTEIRLWLGSIFGTVLSMWVPVIFSFPFGFTIKSHLFSFIFGFILLIILFASKNRCNIIKFNKIRIEFFILPVLVLCFYLIYNHTLVNVDGALYTGQCTYGDMCMHLGFITSMAEQGTFPPEYSILPGELLCYPFLCDSVSASLYLLGTALRWSYMLPMFFAFTQVLFGVWFLAEEICKSRKTAILSWFLFFFNGGLGMIYYSKDYSFKDLFTGFYKTPTNLVDKGMRWVNIIADMLLPQRATLFGWAALMGCFYLLYLAIFKEQKEYALPAGILGGLLPMIHTHSFFALGLFALCWLVWSVVQKRFSKDIIITWLFFGLPAVLLALPQLIIWTFHSVGGNSQFLRLNFDWVNGGNENWFWFWFKNVGPIFIIFPIAFIFSDKRYKAICSGSIFIFILCEFFVFQPNVYDNNKLLYIGYLFALFLSGNAIFDVFYKINKKALRNLLLVLFIIISTNAGIFTIAREVVSGLPKYGYRLFSEDEVAAATYIQENTEPDAKFLTDDNHNNLVAVLTGRNIVCGSSSYLYYHGLDYAGQQQIAEYMLTSTEAFEHYKESSEIDYVYFGYYERAMNGNIEEYLDENYPLVFSQGSIKIYKINS